MKYAVIDVGSNSVRLMVSDEEKSEYKKINTTRLALGLTLTGNLDKERMTETADAIAQYANEAKLANCGATYVFATEAVRSANNMSEFVDMLASKGIDIDVVASDVEAKLGFAGAYTHGTCCVLDIGGGSSEIAVGDMSGLSYAKSLPIGLMRIYDKCKEDVRLIDGYVESTIAKYGEVPKFENLLAIGGTATTFAAIKEKMKIYDPKIVDGYMLTKHDIEQMTAEIRKMDMAQRYELAGLERKRAGIIVGGGMLLTAIMTMLKCDFLTVRESDNLEGYLKYKLGLLK